MTDAIRTLQPPSVLLMGAAGSGKTTSLATLLLAGLEVFVLSTEPDGMASLLDRCAKLNIPLDKLHWHSASASMPDWDAVEAMARTANTMSYSDISDLKQGVEKRKMTQFMDLIKACRDFPDDRTGQRFGDVTQWDSSRALVIDSLSGVNKMAREFTVGYKPTLHQGEWGTAMQIEENFLYKLNYDRSCFFIVCAHVDREPDEIAGGFRITVAALGRKLAPQLVKYFSEVVLVKRDSDKFFWSTSETNVDVKNRSLSISATLAQDFSPIVTAYRERAKRASA